MPCHGQYGIIGGMENSTSCTRRHFLAGASAVCASAAVAAGRNSTFVATAPLDEHLTLVLSGLPQVGDATGAVEMRARIDAILSLSPLPRRVLALGGPTSHLAPLAAAGMDVLGCDDATGHRFVETPDCDFLLLDPGAGERSAQEILARRSSVRPLFVCSRRMPSGSLLARVPRLAGVLHVRDNRWQATCEMMEGGMCSALALPSCGQWGDLGYVLLRSGAHAAVASLHQDGFRPAPGQASSADWRAMAAANSGACCRFAWAAEGSFNA